MFCYTYDTDAFMLCILNFYILRTQKLNILKYLLYIGILIYRTIFVSLRKAIVR